MTIKETVNHPAHYGGADNPYEAIKVIEAWRLGFCLGNAIKYICRAGKKGSEPIGDPEDRVMAVDIKWILEDLRKANWYLEREITRLENEQKRGVNVLAEGGPI